LGRWSAATSPVQVTFDLPGEEREGVVVMKSPFASFFQLGRMTAVEIAFQRLQDNSLGLLRLGGIRNNHRTGREKIGDLRAAPVNRNGSTQEAIGDFFRPVRIGDIILESKRVFVGSQALPLVVDLPHTPSEPIELMDRLKLLEKIDPGFMAWKPVERACDGGEFPALLGRRFRAELIEAFVEVPVEIRRT